MRFAFVLDQQVGLRTQALNLERVVREDPNIEATFVPVRYEAVRTGVSALLAHGIPNHLRGAWSGVQEIRAGLGDVKRFDAILWATWSAKSVPDLIAAVPSFLVMDMTPTQMTAMGDLYNYSRARARFLGGWKQRATSRIYRQASHLFPWNDWVAHSLCQDWDVPASKMTVVSPGVDTTLFHPDAAAKSRDSVLRILFVGGDFERKGGDLLLRWMAARPKVPAVELHLVTRDIPAEMTGDNIIPGVFVHRGIGNNSPELVRLYQQSDVFVLPTRADAYSLVALEAMACGLPVVISHVGGIPDIVSEGESGFLTIPDDYAALASRLDMLVESAALREGMGAAARARACAKFDCSTEITKLLAAMKAAAKKQ